MKRFGPLVACIGSIVFAGPALASDGPAGFAYDIQILSNDAVVGTARIPQGATLTITARRGQDDTRTHVQTYSGDVSLVANAEGKELVTLHGDQLVVTRAGDR
jgi:hypothetical protein